MSGFWSVDRVATALRERAAAPLPAGSTPLAGISTDTRAVTPGDCFVALRGERFDGHRFVDEAIAAGAGALVLDTAPAAPVPVPVFLVDDTLRALADLARSVRVAWGGTVVAIAGSNGKTTTKELIRAAAARARRVHATRGNLNNRVGVPLTLLALPMDAEVAVVELGSNLPGEVATLRDIARPDIAVVTSIAEEHLEGFGSLDGVLQEEASACDGVPLAIVPVTEAALVAEAHRRAARVVVAGLDRGDVYPARWAVAPDGRGTVEIDGVEISSPLRGVHNLRNLMLAIAVARALGVADRDVAQGIAAMAAPPMRAAWERVGALTVINDAYNANPGSARAALALLGAAPATQRVAVLGTMRELGADAARYHDEIALAALATLARPGDVVAGIGDFAAALARVAPADPRALAAADVDDVWPALAARLQRDATVLLKASRGVRLERILPLLTRWADRAC